MDGVSQIRDSICGCVWEIVDVRLFSSGIEHLRQITRTFLYSTRRTLKVYF